MDDHDDVTDDAKDFPKFVMAADKPNRSQESSPDLVSRSEAAKMLGVHDDTIYRWSRQGLLNPIKLPSGIARYRVSDLEAIRKGQGHGSS